MNPTAVVGKRNDSSKSTQNQPKTVEKEKHQGMEVTIVVAWENENGTPPTNTNPLLEPAPVIDRKVEWARSPGYVGSRKSSNENMLSAIHRLGKNYFIF